MRRAKRTTLVTIFCLSLLAGLGLSRKIYIEAHWWQLIFLPSLFLIRRRSLVGVFIITIIGLGLGIIRGDNYMQRLSTINLLSGKTVTMQASATNDAIYGKSSQIEFNADNLKIIESHKIALAGKAKISGFGVPMVYRGDEVILKGKIYPSRGSNQLRMSYAQIEIIGSTQDYFSKISRAFSTGIENALPEPQASFAMGLLVGQRTNLPANLITQLTAVGLIHIVAVSGYNLTILIRAIQRLRLGSKYQRLLLSLLLIFSFLLITGTSASIVRAAIVSCLSLAAWYYGRTFKPLLLIAIAAALTAVYNPFYVWSDIGWYLSFLAFFGVLMLAPLAHKYILKDKQQVLTLVLFETLSAEIMTLPLIMFVFGQFSVVALLANILVVPLVPLAMLFSATAALAGVFLSPFAGWFALPANILLTYILDVVNMLANIPNVVMKVSISATLMISLYILAALLIGRVYNRSTKLAKSR